MEEKSDFVGAEKWAHNVMEIEEVWIENDKIWALKNNGFQCPECKEQVNCEYCEELGATAVPEAMKKFGITKGCRFLKNCRNYWINKGT